jgi:ribosomal 50S subunit-recycling heat shock protein
MWEVDHWIINVRLFKSKSIGKKLIDGWDVKIEENWGKINW